MLIVNILKSLSLLKQSQSERSTFQLILYLQFESQSTPEVIIKNEIPYLFLRIHYLLVRGITEHPIS